MQFARENVLRWEDIPDDEPLLDEMIALVDGACTGANRPDADAPPDKRARGKKVRRIVSAALFYGLLLSLLAGAFFISQGNKKPVFGYSLMNVLTWSMEPEIPQGALVVIKQADPNTIQIGDDITFMRDPATSITHRVIGIREDFENSGARGFETQGIDNETPDFEIVPAVNVVGVVKFHVPKLGGWLDWLRGNLWITLGFTVGGVLLVFLLRGALKKSPAENGGKSKRTGKKVPAG